MSLSVMFVYILETLRALSNPRGIVELRSKNLHIYGPN